MKPIMLTGLLLLLADQAVAQDKTPDAETAPGPSIADMGFLIGDWQGEAKFLYPRDKDSKPVTETVHATCAYILNETYIECDTNWTRDDDAYIRTFQLHFNYSEADNAYQALFLYDNWPRHLSYFMQANDARRVFTGFIETEDATHGPGRERVEWRISEDGNVISVGESNQFGGDPEDYWARNFEFTWRRVM